MRVLVFDPRIAGASGDMIIASLIDLGAPRKPLENLCQVILNVVPYVKDVDLEISKTSRRGIASTYVKYKAKEDIEEIEAGKMVEYVKQVCKDVGLDEESTKIALEMLKIMVEAESRIHGEKHVHFHELASSDTIFDIVGSVLLIKNLGLERNAIYSLPPVVGSGYIKMEHGIVPAPAPAVLEIAKIRRIPLKQLPIEEELLTPTGIAILSTLARFVDTYPPMTIESVGYGAGSKELKEVPNVLRAVLGSLNAQPLLEPIAILETSVDDVPAEVVGHVMDRLFEEGALDVQVYTSTGKKSRTFYNIKVLTRIGDEYRLAELLIRELGTLGVRINKLERIVAERRVVPIEIEIDGYKYSVRVKVSRLGGKVVNVKPEYEDVKIIAKDLRRPFREIYTEVLKKVKELIGYGR